MGVFMRDEGRMETEDVILGKAKYEDWRSIYRNVWSRPETAEYMVWKVTADEDGPGRGYRGRSHGRKPMMHGWSMRGAAGRPLVLPERRTDQRSGKTYELEIYKKNLESIGVGYEAG